MPYTHFRFISYEVPTVTSTTGNAPFIAGWDSGTPSAAVARISVPNTVTDEDAYNRLRRLASVVDETDLRLRLLLNDNANTLKIFVVPEFYFRPNGQNSGKPNTYLHPTANQIFDALDTMFNHQDFRNWLLVCGTVVWQTDTAKGTEDYATPIYRNTAIYMCGGTPNSMRPVEKNLPSGSDGVPVWRTPGNDDVLKNYYTDLKMRKQRVFVVDGTMLGLEICLDHQNIPQAKVLRRTLAEWDTNPIPRVKLHILTAGGAPINPESVTACTNGFIMRNDGITNNPTHSELRQIQGYQTSSTNPQLIADANMDINSVAVLGNAIAPEAHFAPTALLPDPGGNYQTFAQRICFYPVQPIPA